MNISGVSNLKANNNHPKININSTDSIVYNGRTRKFVYISKAPPIKNMVVSGGGAKGVIIPGVFAAFEDFKMEDVKGPELKDKTPNGMTFREQLDHVGGSSVGALSAALFAIGMPSKDFTEVLSTTDFKGLLGSPYRLIRKDGKPLVEFVSTHQKNTIVNYLKQMFKTENLINVTKEQIEKEVFHKLHSYGKVLDQEKIGKIYNLITNLLDMASHSHSRRNLLAYLNNDVTSIVIDYLGEDLPKFSVTFSMLDILHELDSKVFKTFTVTATCRENGKTYYFDGEKTPNLDIALACRASGSLPLILKKVVIDRESLSPGYAKYFKEGQESLTFIDGGYFDNIPVQPMENKQGEGLDNRGIELQNLQTLTLVFDETGRADHEQSAFHEHVTKEHALYDSTKITHRIIRDGIAKLFGKIKSTRRNTLTKEEGLETVRQKYAQRSIPLLVDLKTSDFKKAKTLETEYFEKGYKQGMEYLENHKNELIYRDYDNFDDLVKALKPVEKEKLEEIYKFGAAIFSKGL